MRDTSCPTARRLQNQKCFNKNSKLWNHMDICKKSLYYVHLEGRFWTNTKNHCKNVQLLKSFWTYLIKIVSTSILTVLNGYYSIKNLPISIHIKKCGLKLFFSFICPYILIKLDITTNYFYLYPISSFIPLESLLNTSWIPPEYLLNTSLNTFLLNTS